MGYIKEPKGVDFIIKSRPLTKEEELIISEHIRNYKLKNSASENKVRPSLSGKSIELV